MDDGNIDWGPLDKALLSPGCISTLGGKILNSKQQGRNKKWARCSERQLGPRATNQNQQKRYDSITARCS